ncbi:MAG: TonB family protein, partial [Burkholderiaceae bacterium]
MKRPLPLVDQALSGALQGLDGRAFALAVGLHGAALLWVWMEIGQVDLQVSSARPMMASIIAPYQEAPAVKPPPAAKRPEPQQKKPILATDSNRPSPLDIAREKARPREQLAPVVDSERKDQGKELAASAEVIAPRFDADYLNNPKPGYPMMSKRLGEEGQVLLRVLVSSQGSAEQVQLLRSSGFPRLDEAAQEAVAKWRFVPAKVGSVATTAWVQ